MPRQEINNPSNRIARLVVEYEEMKLYAEELFSIIFSSAPHLVEQLPATPVGVAYAQEITRQGLTKQANLKQLMHRRKVRAIAPEGTHPSSRREAVALREIQFTPEELALIEEIKRVDTIRREADPNDDQA